MIGLCAKCAMWIVYMIKKSGKQTKKKANKPIGEWGAHTRNKHTIWFEVFAVVEFFSDWFRNNFHIR